MSTSCKHRSVTALRKAFPGEYAVVLITVDPGKDGSIVELDGPVSEKFHDEVLRFYLGYLESKHPPTPDKNDETLDPLDRPAVVATRESLELEIADAEDQIARTMGAIILDRQKFREALIEAVRGPMPETTPVQRWLGLYSALKRWEE